MNKKCLLFTLAVAMVFSLTTAALSLVWDPSNSLIDGVYAYGFTKGFTYIDVGINDQRSELEIYNANSGIELFSGLPEKNQKSLIKENSYTDNLVNSEERIASQAIERGGNAMAPTDPANGGYYIKSWDKDFSCLTDMDVSEKHGSNWTAVEGNPTLNLHKLGC